MSQDNYGQGRPQFNISYPIFTAQQGRGAVSNPNRRTVFDRLDSGPPRDRMSNRTQQSAELWDQRMVEVDVNPQDVPRGKRYFMVCICY